MTCTQSFLGGLFWKWYRDGWGRTSNRETAWSANIYWTLAMCQLYKDGFGFYVVLESSMKQTPKQNVMCKKLTGGNANES